MCHKNHEKSFRTNLDSTTKVQQPNPIIYMDVSKNRAKSQNGWFIMKNPIKNGWFGGTTPIFWKHPYKISIIICYDSNWLQCRSCRSSPRSRSNLDLCLWCEYGQCAPSWEIFSDNGVLAGGFLNGGFLSIVPELRSVTVVITHTFAVHSGNLT